MVVSCFFPPSVIFLLDLIDLYKGESVRQYPYTQSLPSRGKKRKSEHHKTIFRRLETACKTLSVCCVLSRFRCAGLCDPMDCSPPGSSDHGILQARILVGCHAQLQEIFPTQESNQSLLLPGSLPQQDPGVPSGWTVSVSERERERDQTGVCSRVWPTLYFWP